MIRGLYIAAAGMKTQQSKMDVVTNNLANSETAGFKEDSLMSRSFRDMLISRLQDPAVVGRTEEVGPLNAGIHIDEICTSFEQGPLRETGLETDLALEGSGFFAVLTPDGERYTRSGQFMVSAEGVLTTPEGYPVLGENGPAVTGNAGFAVNAGGFVQAGDAAFKLKVVDFENPQGLRKEGNNLYCSYSAGQPAASAAQVRQGYLEESNVDLSSQMVNMIEISRNYDLNQRVIRMMDEKLGRSVSEIGKL